MYGSTWISLIEQSKAFVFSLGLEEEETGSLLEHLRIPLS